MEELILRTARQRVHGFTSQTCFDPLIISVNFCPCFLKDEHPDLIAAFFSFRWLRKSPCFSLSVIREVIVNDYCAFLSIDVKTDSVASSLVYFICKEDFLDPVGCFGYG